MLIAIFIVLFLYLIVRFLIKRVPAFRPIEKFLRKKLFFSVGIRYLIQSSIKLCYTCFIFLIYVGLSFDTQKNRINSAVNIAILVILILWPFFLTTFLLLNRRRLDSEKF